MNDSISDQLLAALGVATFEFFAGRSARLVGSAPFWFDRLVDTVAPDGTLDVAAAFPFLEGLLNDEQGLWRQTGPERLYFGKWTESDNAGNQFLLEGSTLWLGRKRILLVALVDQRIAEVLQKARSAILRAEQDKP